MPRNENRRGNWENDILSLLLYAARAADDPNRKLRNPPSGNWVTMDEMSESPPYGLGIPRSTLNYIAWFEEKGIVSRVYKVDGGKEYAKTRESVMDRIATKYGIRYKWRRVHVYDGGARRMACACGNPTDEWEIAARFIEEPKDAEWDRWVNETLFGGEHAVGEDD